MPQIPAQLAPDVQPQGQPGAFESAQASPGDFGGFTAAATAKVGQATDQLGNTLADAAVKFQTIQNQTNVNDVYANSFSPAFRDQYQKYYALQGKDAVDQMPQAIQQMQQTRQQVEQSLPNAAQQRMFNDISRRRVEMELDGMSRYADQQNKIWQDTTFQSGLKNQADQVGDKYNDEHAFGTAIGNAAGLIDGYAVQTGKPAEWAREQLSQFQGLAATQRVQRWMVDDPQGAQKWYQDNTNMIPASARPALEHQLHALVLPIEAKQVGMEALSQVIHAPQDAPAVPQTQTLATKADAEGMQTVSMSSLSPADRAKAQAVQTAGDQGQTLTLNAGSVAPARESPYQDPRANLSAAILAGDQMAEQKHPGDPVFRDLVQTQIRGYVGTMVSMQEGQQRQNHQTLVAAAIGGQGGQKPMSLDDLLSNPATRQAWMNTDPTSQRGVLAILDHTAKAANGELSAGNPGLFNQLRSDVWRDQGDPKKIVSPAQLTAYFSDDPAYGKGLNYTQQQRLIGEIKEANDPEGSVFGRQVNQAKKTAEKMLTGSVSSLTVAHPELAEEAASRFSFDLDQKIKAARAAGVDPQSLFVPGSKDYVLDPSRVAAFMPTEAQVAAQKAGQTPAAPAQPSLWSRLTGGSTAPAAPAYPTATNKTTGERQMFKDGKWQPLR